MRTTRAATRTTRAATTLLGVAACGIALTLSAPALGAQESTSGHADRQGVERAALDYLEGFYEGSEDKIRRGVHPDAHKFGFYREDGEYHQSPMSFEEMLAFARNVRESQNFPRADAPKRVEVLDVLDQTAVAKVYAWWGSDYLTLARYDGEWKIVQVLWQSPPEG